MYCNEPGEDIHNQGNSCMFSNNLDNSVMGTMYGPRQNTFRILGEVCIIRTSHYFPGVHTNNSQEKRFTPKS